MPLRNSHFLALRFLLLLYTYTLCIISLLFLVALVIARFCSLISSFNCLYYLFNM